MKPRQLIRPYPFSEKTRLKSLLVLLAAQKCLRLPKMVISPRLYHIPTFKGILCYPSGPKQVTRADHAAGLPAWATQAGHKSGPTERARQARATWAQATQAGQPRGPTKRANQAGQPSGPTKRANQAGHWNNQAGNLNEPPKRAT